MKLFFYPKLAAHNIKNNRQTYLPYLLTCIFTVAMFYIMFLMSVTPSDSTTLQFVLQLGVFVIGLFSAIFLFYTNSFLIKRRKKEIGLYNILGMTKGNLARMLAWEYFQIGVLSIVLGLGTGILFSKLMYMLLEKLMNFSVTMKFMISPTAMWVTALFFAGIFFCTLLFGLLQVKIAKPVELLAGGNVGEREPKTKWLMTILGVLALGSGYFIATTTESPMVAIMLFFVAVILVIIGTYFLFTAGSVAFLKLLRRNKRYYYQMRHFISVSGMIYRMKQNAAGLASICILSTCVLVALSTTISMYAGMGDAVKRMYPYEVQAFLYDSDAATGQEAAGILRELAAEKGVTLSDVAGYSYLPITAQATPDGLDPMNITYIEDVIEFNFLTTEEYNRVTGASVTLGEDEALLYEAVGSYKEDTISLLGREYRIRERLSELPVIGSSTTLSLDELYVVVNDTDSLYETYVQAAEEEGHAYQLLYRTCFLGFNTDLSGTAEEEFATTLSERLGDGQLTYERVSVKTRSANEGFMAEMYGGLLFLGIFLGALFLVGTVLIIYYKQITEGLDDKPRFEIMQKVGMSRSEVRHAINSQILTVFFFPLIVAAIHVGFAFKFISRMLLALAFNNIALFALATGITVLVFALIYTVVYLLTSHAYYRIVR